MENQTAVHVTVIVSVLTFVVAMMAVMAMELKHDSPSSLPAPRRIIAEPADAALLRHCRDLGEAATRDAVCLRLWAANRDAFLGRSTTGSKP